MGGAEHLHAVDFFEAIDQHFVSFGFVQRVDGAWCRQQHRADDNAHIGVDLRGLAELAPNHLDIAIGGGFNGARDVVERLLREVANDGTRDFFGETLGKKDFGNRCRVRGIGMVGCDADGDRVDGQRRRGDDRGCDGAHHRRN